MLQCARAMPASAVSRPRRPQWPQLAVPTTPGKWSLDWQMAKVWQPLSPTMICNPVIRQPRSYSPVIRWWQARTCYDLRRRLKRRRCSRNKTQWGIWLILISLTWNIYSKMHQEETRQNIEIALWQLDFTRKILLRWRRLERRQWRRGRCSRNKHSVVESDWFSYFLPQLYDFFSHEIDLSQSGYFILTSFLTKPNSELGFNKKLVKMR